MDYYDFPTTTEVTTLEGTTISTTVNNGYNFIFEEQPVPSFKLRGIAKACQDVFAWQKAPDEDWITPTLLNGWTDFSSGWTTGYYKSKDNIVYVRGLVRLGTATAGTVIFNLPAGYRPEKNHAFPATSNTAFAEVRANSAGTITIQAGSNALFSLSSISFRAFN